MAMTLTGVLGRPIEDLEDAVLAQAGFSFAKHGLPEGFTDWLEATQDRINSMSNMDLLVAISNGIETLKHRGHFSS
jgi:hypothetical protein